ncbi:hypothetical protein [Paenibacillus sp. NPDC057934]|uniref:hypothetical protein n=1 Tax=Paenibacillus sp. NPDC057934 TaxID=3346282 RepID=UPI0036DD0939
MKLKSYRKYFLIFSLLIVVFTSGSFNTLASAEPATEEFTVTTSAVEPSNDGAVLQPATIQLQADQTIPVSRPAFSIMANYDVTGGLMNFTDSLTAADPTDFWFFSVPTNRNILFQIKSTNSNYRVELYKIDWTTGTATSTNISSAPNNVMYVTGLGAGDWGLRVTSIGTLGTSYSIHMNATNPFDHQAAVLSYTNSLLYAVMQYPDDKIFVNGTFVASTKNAADVNPHLDWKRDYTFSYGGNYSSRNHSISDVRVSRVTTGISYSSASASSNNAVLLYLKEGTLFTYFESEFRSGPPTQHYSSFVDTSGRTTPRRFDFIDTAGDPDLLVFDLNTNKVIDFVSSLNKWYASGSEPSPTINFYN